MTLSDGLTLVANLFAIGRAVADALSKGDTEKVQDIVPGTLRSEIRLSALRARAEEKFGG